MTVLPFGLVLRAARADELPACADVWRAGLDRYGRDVGRPPMIAAPGPLVALLAHLQGTDPDHFLVAVRPEAGGAERVVAFASAVRRDHVWFLGMLFVHPDEQAHGLGRTLLEAVLPGSGDRATLATCTDAAQPVSNALYARYGIVPRMPVLELVGRPDRGYPVGLPEGVRAVPFELLAAGPSDGPGPRRLAAAIDGLDRAILGYAHPQDHAFLGATGRLGHLYEAGDGRVVGYGYVSPVGRIGPLAVEDSALLPGVLGHLLRAVEPAGAFSAWVPGAAGPAVTSLLDAGLRIEDFPALLCWDRPFADFARYVPITLAVL
ncbi:MAG: GNAT family N-acetyltransferase [Chloroflexota bacterium]